ncbi:MAG: serine hydrolase, partial [Acidobacteriota bacterium]|nr:serine hydrolase [Acidobacteriota bacterium]
TNALTGILVKRGLLKLDDPLPVPEWAEGDPRKAITLRHVLHMSSGLTFQEVYEPGTDVVGMLFRHHSAATFVAGKDLGAPPGTKWYYSSGTTNLLARALRLAMGDNHRDYLALPRTALFNKIGMSSAVIEPDPSGHFIGSSFSYATARDWARLGLLYLNDGVWDGERILPEGWVAFSRQAAPAAPEGRYGAHFWTNLGSDETGKDRPWPYLPRDTFNMEGFEGQRVIMIPSMELVIVRLGQTPSNGRFHFPRLTREILAALPVVNK